MIIMSTPFLPISLTGQSHVADAQQDDLHHQSEKSVPLFIVHIFAKCTGLLTKFSKKVNNIFSKG